MTPRWKVGTFVPYCSYQAEISAKFNVWPHPTSVISRNFTSLISWKTQVFVGFRLEVQCVFPREKAGENTLKLKKKKMNTYRYWDVKNFNKIELNEYYKNL